MGAVRKFDEWMLFRVIHPLSWWIDKNYHVNPWRVAIGLIVASMVMLAVDMGTIPITSNWPLIAVPFIGLLRWFDIRTLKQISDKYERDPAHFQMPFEWYRFAMPFNRAGNTILGILFLSLDIGAVIGPIAASHSALHTAFLIGRMISQQWILVVGIGYYFAACIMPPGQRKKKKVRDWSFGMMPQGAPT